MSPVFPGYEVERLLGRGGMAEVFLARVVGGPRAGTPVALKRLLPSLAGDAAHAELFAREARLAARLAHPNVVEVVEVGAAGGAPFIAMEYVDGADAARLVACCAAKGLRIPLEFALYVAHQVALALDHAHRLPPGGLVHCDVSPSNVLLSRAGDVKLGDFGVARAAGDARGRGAYGKVRYLAPEQLRGDPVGPATDVFALGAVLYELLTAAPAFPGRDAEEIARRIVAGPRRAPSLDRPDVPPALDALVLRALDPRDRHATAGALAAELAGLYDPSIGNRLAIAALVRGVVAPA